MIAMEEKVKNDGSRYGGEGQLPAQEKIPARNAGGWAYVRSRGELQFVTYLLHGAESILRSQPVLS